MRVELGTFKPPADATDEQLEEWAVLLADEIANRMKEERDPMAEKPGLAEAIARVEAAETSEDGVERDPESEDPIEEKRPVDAGE